MKCPKCNKEVMSKMEFYILSNPFWMKCRRCSAILKPNNKMRKYQMIELLIGIIIGTLIGIQIIPYNIVYTIITVLLLLILIIPLEYLSWEKGELLLRKKEG